MKKILLLAILAVFLMVGNAMAVPFLFNGSSLQDSFNSITISPNNGVSSINVYTDSLADSADSYWHITASGGSIATIMFELAGNASTNTFGIFDPTDPSNHVQLFNGPATDGAQVALSITAQNEIYVNFSNTGIKFGTSSFGYYLGSSLSPTGFWYSDSSLNGGQDHMLAYQGTDTDTIQIANLSPGLWTNNEYALAFEDQNLNNTDADYNDFVAMVESVQPTPEPATMLLLGTGLIGLAGFGRKRFSKKA